MVTLQLYRYQSSLEATHMPNMNHTITISLGAICKIRVAFMILFFIQNGELILLILVHWQTLNETWEPTVTISLSVVVLQTSKPARDEKFEYNDRFGCQSTSDLNLECIITFNSRKYPCTLTPYQIRNQMIEGHTFENYNIFVIFDKK